MFNAGVLSIGLTTACSSASIFCAIDPLFLRKNDSSVMMIAPIISDPIKMPPSSKIERRSKAELPLFVGSSVSSDECC